MWRFLIQSFSPQTPVSASVYCEYHVNQKNIFGDGELTLSRQRQDVKLNILTVWNKPWAVLCLYTHLYMFLKKMTQHVDNATCFNKLSQVSCCACVCRDDIGIPVCHIVMCRRHSSRSVFSVHKNKKCKLSLFVLPLPMFFFLLVMLLCSLSGLVVSIFCFVVDFQMICI